MNHGMAAHARCVFRALEAACLEPRLVDIYPGYKSDRNYVEEFDGHTRKGLGSFNIFCINGDEVEKTLIQVGGLNKSAINVIYPFWELSKYPQPLLNRLRIFDEVWVASRFIAESISRVSDIQCRIMSMACEPRDIIYRPKSWFGLRNSAFVFLFVFDAKSFTARKNPRGVIEAFGRLKKLDSWADTQLLIKIAGSSDVVEVRKMVSSLPTSTQCDVMIMDQILSDNDIKALIATVDCVVSLHRSEGFGRLLSEAMYLGIPAVATAYGGNMDFMNANNSWLVPYSLIPVQENEYPYGEGQAWAEPDMEVACSEMRSVMRNGTCVNRKVSRGRADVMKELSYLTIGMRYRERIQEYVEMVT